MGRYGGSSLSRRRNRLLVCSRSCLFSAVILCSNALQHAYGDWLVKTYLNGSQVRTLADADALVRAGFVVGTATIAEADMVGFNSGEGTGHYSANHPVPGIPNTTATDNYVVQCTAYLEITSGGQYTFGLNTDDGARLKIDGRNIIIDDVIASPHDSSYATLSLAAGIHFVEWTWFNQAGGVSGGGAVAEAYAAVGAHATFNSNFKAIGAAGGLRVFQTVPIGTCVLASGEVGNDLVMRLPFPDGHSYKVTQGYCSPGGDHSGYQVDFALPAWTPVVAAAAGRVEDTGDFSGNCPNGCGDSVINGGIYVKLRHEGRSGVWYSSYLHLTNRVVQRGDAVISGQLLGHSGSTGWSTGYHLHFHIRNGPTSSHIGFRPTPMDGIELETGVSPITEFREGYNYRAATKGWLVKTYRDSSAVRDLAKADALIGGNFVIGIATIPEADIVGFNTGEGTGHFTANHPVPGIPTLSATGNYAVQGTGYLLIPSSGQYTFGLNTDDGARLRIDGRNVIIDDLIAPPHDSAYVTLYLTAGEHLVEWTWFDAGGGAVGEAYAASGSHASLNSNFKPLGNPNGLTVSQAGLTPLATELAAYFPFNGDARDLTGYNAPGVGVNVSFSQGLVDLCLGTTGNLDSLVEIPSSPLLAPKNAVSVSLWFKQRAVQDQYACLLYKSAATPMGAGFTDRSYTLWVLPHGGGIHFTSTGTGSGSQTILNTSTGLFQANEWVHVVAVVDALNRVMRVYVNGNLSGTISFPSAEIVSGPDPLRIGTPFLTGGDQAGLNGLIDEVRIYNRAISPEEVQQLYEVSSVPAPPSIAMPPHSQTAQLGITVALSAIATGTPPLSYQWRKNGVNIPAANSATFTLNSVTLADNASYSVLVSNSFGTVQSRPASLAVLNDGAQGKKQEQTPKPVVLTPKPTERNLVVVTHGWNPLVGIPPPTWVDDMVAAIQKRLTDAGKTDWVVMPIKWREAAWGTQDMALIGAEIEGSLYGAQFSQTEWNHIHLIGHSAGSAFINAFAWTIKSIWPRIHTTFLDPYKSLIYGVGSEVYGSFSDWSDCYFARDMTGPFTGGLPKAYSFDVSWLDDRTSPNLLLDGSCIKYSDHSWPTEFYVKSITGDLKSCVRPYGFDLSKEAGGWANHADLRAGESKVLCPGPCSTPLLTVPSGPVTLNGRLVDLSDHSLSDVNSFIVGDAGFTIKTKVLPPSPLMRQSVGTRSAAVGARNSDNAPWLALAVPVTNLVNFIQFEAEFTSAPAAEGLFTL
jgi:murein DD-endopeptidase MepM/ murein hydrolase activator NlpD